MEEKNENPEELFYIINDLNEFVDAVRKIVFHAFGEDVDKDTDNLFEELKEFNDTDAEEMERLLSKKECLNISKSYIQTQKNKKTNKKRIVMSMQNFNDFIEAINSRLVSNLLASLVKKGLIETAYDPEANDFIFWTINNNEKENDDEKSN